ncbi:MAG: AMP-binding protein [Hyphomonadaceae bacterium]|nr:AMP-binding protein [Hyphomonadaceae bacterium]GIK49477.1 MAG: acyl-CoA synthetase [Alphaproteobacteria bacterium]
MSAANALYRGPTLGDLFLRALKSNPPDRLAVWDDREELTFAQFAARVAGFSDAMRAAGLRPGQALAQLSKNKADALCAIAAAFLVGLRYTPLHPLASAADHAFILADAQIDALVVDEEGFSANVESLRQAMRPGAIVFSHNESAFGLALRSGRVQADALYSEARPEDIALIAYTGGTTGRAKGVVHRHASLVTNLLLAMGEWEWRDPIRFVAATPISHAAFLFVLPVLLRGGSFGMAGAFSPAAFAELVERRGVTATFLVPTMIYALLDAPETVQSKLAGLDTIIYGAAPIASARLEQALQRFGPIFAQLYGQTEAPNAISMLFKRDHTPDRLSSCGVALAANKVAVLDAASAPVKIGEVGEICVRGPLLMDGYWNRPEESAAAFESGWLHTGDLGRMDENGFIYLVDRKKDMIISGGFNIYPREVEDVLSTHPAVDYCCVAGVADPKWGEATTALVVLKEGRACAPEDLIAHVRSIKGPLMAPKFVLLARSAPLTALGKPDRKAARALLAKAYPGARS